MKSLFSRFFYAATLTGAMSLTMQAVAADTFDTPAEFAVIMDYETGAFLFEKNADTQTAPASMSKLMTVAIVFDMLETGQLNLADKFHVSEKAWKMGGSKMWVRVDTEISVSNLLHGVIVQSGNDACIVIAENIAGSEEAFADLMTKKAREWGMNDSTFANSTGWPDENQKMSMRDLALLTHRMISDYPEYYALFKKREFTWEKIRQPNRNPLLDTFDGSDGLKTGHTDESGYGLVGSAVKGGERRIIVVNGLTSEKQRSTETARLMRIAFNDFETRTLFKVGDVVGDARVFKGVRDATPLVLHEKVALIVHRQDADKSAADLVYEGPVSAPIIADQQIGYLRVKQADGKSVEYPLYAAKAVREVGVFGKIALAAKSLLMKPEIPKNEDSPATDNP